MNANRAARTLALLLPFAAAAACATAAPERTPAPRTVQPGAPGEASRVIDPRAEPAATAATYTAADVRFMQGMLIHHAQALRMAALVPDRAGSEAIRRMARRIDISQRSEIDQMQRWLRARREAVPPLEADDHGAHGRMPGMATEEQMARLAAAQGTAFDRLFLDLMIRHHEGALVMVADLLATDGGGREPELFQLLSHIDADQRAEIARMQELLDRLERPSPS